MLQKTARVLASSALFMVGLCAPHVQQVALAQTPAARSAGSSGEHNKASVVRMTKAQKIALAMSAGPAAISKDAAIADMTDMTAGQTKELRPGTNGWVCYAMTDQPMCLDKEWQKWLQALMSKGELKVEGTGIAYMLRGDKGASNTYPYATGPTADNQWVVSPAHLMLLFPDTKMLDAYPTDPENGGPWVMWKGTPYAHVMVPVSPTRAAMMPSK